MSKTSAGNMYLPGQEKIDQSFAYFGNLENLDVESP